MYLHKTPAAFRLFFPNILWRKITNNKEIYLTFDDGPIPEATPWILDLLDQYNAKATFFMVGENVERYPDVYKDVIKRGHAIGNHTHNHLNGWASPDHDYIENTQKAESLLADASQKLFRPPHGRIKPSQYAKMKADYKIVMWDVLSADFDKSISEETCLKKTIDATQKGSIVLFHDSVKTIDLVKVVLPRYLNHFHQLKYSFKSL
jgi:peptidoglycan/xylan/chitin deacetylase (PgdA/CDA1 family)